MNADKPFILKGGSSSQVAIENRINAIERIKFLTGGIDLRDKTISFLRAFDLEMWKRWYKDEPPDKKIDEEWCQRASQVALAMESKNVGCDLQEFENAREEHQQKLEKVNDNKHIEVRPEDAGKAE